MMRKHVTAGVAAMALAVALAVAGAGPAAAQTVMTNKGTWATWNHGLTYYGSTQVVYSQVVNYSCDWVQAWVTWDTGTSAGVQTTTGLRTGGTSSAYGGTNRGVSAGYALW